MYSRLLLLWIFLLVNTTVVAGNVSIKKNEASGLLSWMVEDEGISIELVQLIPDFIRAIYAKHNFPADEVERVASYCLFGTIIKNTSEQVMSYQVADWRYSAKNKDGKEQGSLPVKTKTQWLEEWRKKGIIFSWTLLPDIGNFAVGDWQQGFTTIELPRESEFDLSYSWKLDDTEYSGVIKDLKCAPESLPQIN